MATRPPKGKGKEPTQGEPEDGSTPDQSESKDPSPAVSDEGAAKDAQTEGSGGPEPVAAAGDETDDGNEDKAANEASVKPPQQEAKPPVVEAPKSVGPPVVAAGPPVNTSAAAAAAGGAIKGATSVPQYLSPGVYVEEIPSAIKPIAGVGTSTAGFIGVYPAKITIPVPNPRYDPTARPVDGKPPDKETADPWIPREYPRNITEEDVAKADAEARKAEADARADLTKTDLAKAARVASDRALHAAADFADLQRHAPPGEPKLCTTFNDFERFFGTFSETPGHIQLAHSVYGFFNNGGSRCWVMRFVQGTPITLRPFEAIDEIAIVVAPGLREEADQRAILDHCENMRDRFAVLDSRVLPANAAPTPDALTFDRSDYGAVYFPDIEVFDVATKTKDPKGDGRITVAPSGHVAGIYARVDATRGVHKAPANEVIRGALGITYPVSRAIQDGLNPDGVNCIREINGNVRVWGARTIGGDKNLDYKYINVRRLMLFIEESIDEGTQWVVFEPNDDRLWAKIARNVTAFLMNVWRDGALFGNTPGEAFYVKCDRGTNPPESRDLGRVITEIGVAPVRPAEFVIFRITQWAGPQGQQ